MAWETKTQIVNALSVNNTTDADSQYPLFISDEVTLNPLESANIQISAEFPDVATPNNLGVRNLE